VGDGSGLTNLTVGQMVGVISTNNLPPEALQSSGASDWSQLTGIPGAFSDGVDNVLSDADVSAMGYIKTDTNTQLSELDVDTFVANNGYASTSNLAAHVNTTSGNPHQVTAADVGAYTVAAADSVISNAVASIPLDEYVGTNHNGNVDIFGELNVASNLTALAFFGDGQGLTNLNLSGINVTNMAGITGLGSGSIITGTERTSITSNSGQISSNATGLAQLDTSLLSLGANVGALQGSTNDWNTAYGWGDHGGAGYASTSNLAAHVNTTNGNPHQVTAADVGAYTVAVADAVISNAVASIPLDEYVGTNHNGNVDIFGELNVASNLTALAFFGDGSGLTDLNASSLNGVILTNNLPAEALQNGVSDWSQLSGIPDVFADGVDNVLLDADVAAMGYIKLDTNTQLNESEVDAFVSNNGYAMASNTYSKAGTDLAITNALSGVEVDGYVATNHVGDVTIVGAVSVDSISGDGSGLSGITGSQIDLSNIGVYGDLGMGSFTNTAAGN